MMLKRVCAEAAAFCRDRGSDIAKLALQFSVANPQIHTTLVGTANPDNIRKNAGWIEEPIDRELLKGVQKVLAPIRDKTWMLGPPRKQLEEPFHCRSCELTRTITSGSTPGKSILGCPRTWMPFAVIFLRMIWMMF